MAKSKVVNVPVTVVAPVVTAVAPVAPVAPVTVVAPVVTLSAYHTALCEGADSLRTNTLSLRAQFAEIIKARYEGVSPTFGECKEDRAVFAIHDKARGLKNARYSILSYNAAIVSLYGKLPASTEPAAVLQAAKREADKAAKNGVAPQGAPKGETQVHPVSPDQVIEQVLTRIGVDKVLAALSRMLAVESTTLTASKTLAALAKQLAKSA